MTNHPPPAARSDHSEPHADRSPASVARAQRIPALSIRRPWAQLIVDGPKRCENRSWTTKHRGPLVIHASAKYEPVAELHAAAEGLRIDRAACATGFIGVAQLVDVHHDADCDGRCAPWGMPGQQHWVLDDVRPFAAAVPGPGSLGLFVPPAEVLKLARRTLEAAR